MTWLKVLCHLTVYCATEYELTQQL